MNQKKNFYIPIYNRSATISTVARRYFHCRAIAYIERQDVKVLRSLMNINGRARGSPFIIIYARDTGAVFDTLISDFIAPERTHVSLQCDDSLDSL